MVGARLERSGDRLLSSPGRPGHGRVDGLPAQRRAAASPRGPGALHAARDDARMSPGFRPHIERMEGYMPGEQTRAGEFIKLNTNENPYPPSPRVAEAIARALGE